MTAIRQDMPVLARHEGEWTGVYVHMDADGTITDRHTSRVRCGFPEDGPHAYVQHNTYEWPDGRKEEHRFPALYANKRILWDTERIEGHAWEIDARTVCLTWRRKDVPGVYLYEMINLSDNGNHRARTWHWFEDGRLIRRTCIQEARVDAKAPAST